GLTLHPDKTRLLEFGRYAAERRRRRGQRKPKTFQFLGFTHACGRTRAGEFAVRRYTAGPRLRAKLSEVKAELRHRWHDPIREVGRWLVTVVRQHCHHYCAPGHSRAIVRSPNEENRLWQRALSRRGQKSRVTWERMQPLISRWIPRAHIAQPYPSVV